MKPLELAALEATIIELVKQFPELQEDEQLRADMIEGSTNVFDVLSRLVRRKLHAKANGTALTGFIGEMESRRDAFEREEAGYKALIERVMRMADLPKVKLPEATVYFSAGRRGVIVTDLESLPERFVKVTRDARKNDIKDAIDAGEFVPGAELSNGSEALNIRVA